MSIPVHERLRRVSSRQNALLKQLRRGFHDAELVDGACAIESVRTIDEAVRSGLRFRAVFFAESAAQRAERLLPQISMQAETLLLPDEVFASAVATESPQGVAALVQVPERSLEDTLGAARPLVVIAAGVQDPGNLGTLIRSAEAFGANGVAVTKGSVSPWNAKVVRASAGSLFRLPVFLFNSEQISELKQHGVRLLATSSHKGTPIDEADLTVALALLIGNEGAGVPR
jgi:RNA methyltransferase, TrmH family